MREKLSRGNTHDVAGSIKYILLQMNRKERIGNGGSITGHYKLE